MKHGSQSTSVWGPLLLLTIAPFPLTIGCSPKTPPRPLNVVLIVVDTLRADHLGSYGYARDTSPRIDRFARESFLFERNWSQAPCTYPSMNSLLTSRFPVHVLGESYGDFGIKEGVPTLAEMLQARGYATHAISASPIVRVSPTRFNLVGGFGRGFDEFDERCLWKDASCVNGRATSVIRTHAVPDAKPFFLYLHYIDPHGPYRPPEHFDHRFARPYAGEREWVAKGDPNPIARMIYEEGEPVTFTDEDVEHLESLYDDEIAFSDSEIGALLNELELSGLTESTLVLFVSDHGESFMENRQMKHCYHLYEHNVRTPLVIRVPGAAGGRRISSTTSNLDIVPTILDLVDEHLPERSPEARALEVGIQGESLRGLLRDEAVPSERASVAFASNDSQRMVSDGRFKLIKDLASREAMLFDLDTDPRETTNVMLQQRRVFRSLEERLDAWILTEEGAGGALEKTEEAQRQLKALGYLQ